MEIPFSTAGMILALNLLTLYILIPVLRWPFGLRPWQHKTALVLWMGSLFMLAVNIPLWVYFQQQ